jgi:hypothetical protein
LKNNINFYWRAFALTKNGILLVLFTSLLSAWNTAMKHFAYILIGLSSFFIASTAFSGDASAGKTRAV